MGKGARVCPFWISTQGSSGDILVIKQVVPILIEKLVFKENTKHVETPATSPDNLRRH